MSESVIVFSQKSQFSQIAAGHVVYRGRENGNKCTPVFMKDKKKLSLYLSSPCYMIIIVDQNHESELKYLEAVLNKKEGSYLTNVKFCIACKLFFFVFFLFFLSFSPFTYFLNTTVF